MTGYAQRHGRVYKARGKASDYRCVKCIEKAQEWAQIKGTSGESVDHYQPMCCSCHQQYDDHWNEETRKKISETSKERWKDPEYKTRVGAAISASKTKRVCINGHDLANPENRYISGRCKLCQKQKTKERYWRNKGVV